MKRFEIITEADARTLEPGSTVVLVPGGHVTPLAADTLRARRVEVVRGEAVDPDAAGRLAPAFPVRRLALGSDHTGVALRQHLARHLRARGLAVLDEGTEGPDPVDYPDVAARVARRVVNGEADAGIVVDGGGLGSAIAANKVRGIRAAMCSTPTLARYAREHNGANVLTLGSTLVTEPEAVRIVDVWIETPTTEPRYLRRLAKIAALES